MDSLDILSFLIFCISRAKEFSITFGALIRNILAVICKLRASIKYIRDLLKIQTKRFPYLLTLHNSIRDMSSFLCRALRTVRTSLLSTLSNLLWNTFEALGFTILYSLDLCNLESFSFPQHMSCLPFLECQIFHCSAYKPFYPDSKSLCPSFPSFAALSIPFVSLSLLEDEMQKQN